MNTRLSSLVALVGLAIALALAGCGGQSGSTGTGASGSSSGSTAIAEKGFAFQPSTLEVKVGDTVTFTNEDSAPHDVTIDGKDLGQQSQGQSVTWTAEKAGSFPFSCTIHPAMTGEITVK